MATVINKTPYEMLVRWNDAGVLQGASIRWRLAGVEDGVEKASQISDPEPVAVAGGKGFPLADILEQLHADALTAVDDKEASLATKSIQLQESQQALIESNSNIDKLTSQIADLTSELQSFRDAADVAKQEAQRQQDIAKATAFLAEQGIVVAAASAEIVEAVAKV